MNTCATISESLPEGNGQFARANYKLYQLYQEQGRVTEAEKALTIARDMRHNMAKEKEAELSETIDAYNNLNLWMLW